MPTSSPEPADPAEARPIPIAYPPRQKSRVPKPPREKSPAFVVGPLVDPTPAANLWTASSLKGWGGSAGLHAVLLLSLAFWYFTPPVRVPVEFDSRIGGSPHGVDEGTTILGGLNTLEDEPGMTDLELAATPEPLPLLDLKPIEPDRTQSIGRGARPSAAGGSPNENPGAGDGEGFGLARFGDGSEFIRGVQVKVGDPQFTLLWDNDVDLDLHVIEPGGKEIYWEERKGSQGGELDVDNTKGFGPENIYWLVDSDDPDGPKTKGDGPPGVYRWYVAYYGGFGGISKPTQWQVRIKHAGRVTVQRGKLRSLDEKSKTFTLSVGAGRLRTLAGEDEGPFLPPERP